MRIRAKRHWVAHLSVVVLLSSLARAGVGQEITWPQFHGPNRDNISGETGLLKRWPAGGPKLLWTANGLGIGYSSVSIAGELIYTAGNIDEQTVLSAIGLDGKAVWQKPCGLAWTGSYPGSRGTPTVDGDRVYYGAPHGEVACLDAKTGRQVWRVNILKQFRGPNIRWALSESLLVDGDRVICCPGGPEASVVALDKKTGKVVWTCPSTGDLAGYASPMVVEFGGMRIILTLTSRALIGVNAATGALLWRVEHVSYADENVLTPIFHAGHVIVSSLKAGTVKWKIHVRDGKVAVEEVWRSLDLDNHHGGVILLDGHLYGSSCFYNRGKWICLDAKTGKATYVAKGVGKGALTYAGGMLYTLSRGKVVGLVRPTPDRHEVVSQFQLPRGGKGPSWAHPVVCDGRLYIRHGQFLYAYDVRATP